MTRFDVAQWVAMSAFLICSMSIASYILNIPHLRTWADPPMSANTAVVGALLGFAIILISKNDPPDK